MTRERRFLFAMVEGGGNIPPQLSVARALVDRGHRVRVLSDPAVEAEVRGAGCEFSAFRRAPHHNMRNRAADIVKDWEVRSPVAQLERLGRTLLFDPAHDYARDVVEELARFPAEVVAVDWMVPGLHVGAEASGLPTVSLVHHPYFLPTEGIPPWGLGLRPARGLAGRLRDRVVRGAMVRKFDSMGLRAINEARAAFGLGPISSVFDQLRRADRTLVLTSRAFDFGSSAPAIPPQVRYVGPRLDDPAWAAPWENPWPRDHRDPLVLVSLGSTFQNQGKLNARVAAALGALPVRALITLGEVFSPESVPTGTQVVAVRSAPHAAVLPHARAVITHAGHGTLIKALAHGVPVVSIPLGRDQKDNAARAEVAGAGLTLRASASVGKIRRAVRQVLEEPRFAEGASRIADAIREETAQDEAVREMETLEKFRPVQRNPPPADAPAPAVWSPDP